MNKPKVLIVDDSEFNRNVVINTLKDEYEILEAENGLKAIDIINKKMTTLSLVLLDIMMPELNGIEVLKILNENGVVNSLPVILITAADSNEAYGLQLGAVDFIAKPFDPDVLKTRVNTHVKLKTYRDRIEELLAYNINNNFQLWNNAMDVLSALAEYRDLKFSENSLKCKQITKTLLFKLIEDDYNEQDFNADNAKIIIDVMPLRDIGKICIPEKILFKTDPLTNTEREIIKTHIDAGVEIIDKFLNNVNEDYVNYGIILCKTHHENWDGSGYPDGLSGKNIPLIGRIGAVIDTYDALVSERIYREAYTHEEAIMIIEDEIGRKFDPEIASLFLDIEQTVKELYK